MLVSPIGFEPMISPPQTECHNLTWLQGDVILERTAGLEPATYSLEGCRSTNWTMPALDLISWSGQRDSNPWHSRWQRDILPDWIMPAYMVGHKRIELSPRVPQTRVLTCYTNAHIILNLVLKAGLEPAVFRLSVERFNRLSYMSICWWKQWESNPQPAD